MPQSALSDETLELLGEKTKGKILVASLRLFNEFGFDRVTTAQIAKHSNVLEGTLWYHFKAKNDLIFAHLDALEKRIDMHLAVPMSQGPADLVRYIYGIFDFLWDFRYLLRDPLDYLRNDPVGVERVKTVFSSLEDRTEKRLRDAEDAGIIDFSGADMSKIVTITIITGRYWLDYAMARSGTCIDLEVLKAEGFALIMELQKPYLIGPFKELVNDPDMLDTLTKSARTSSSKVQIGST